MRVLVIAAGFVAKKIGYILVAAIGVAAAYVYTQSRGPCPYCGHQMFEAHPQTAECYHCGAIEHLDKLPELRASPRRREWAGQTPYTKAPELQPE